MGNTAHGGLDDPFRHVFDFECQVCGRELKINADLLVNRERSFPFDHILCAHGRAGADREVSRAADRNRVALFVAVHGRRKFLLVRAVHLVNDTKLVFEDGQRDLGNHVRSQGVVSHRGLSCLRDGPSE